MTLQDAILSGKKFRHESWTSGRYIEPGFVSLSLPRNAFTADDWEVEEKQVTITESVLKAAWIEACKNSGYHNDSSPHGWLYKELKKELGL